MKYGELAWSVPHQCPCKIMEILNPPDTRIYKVRLDRGTFFMRAVLTQGELEPLASRPTSLQGFEG